MRLSVPLEETVTIQMRDGEAFSCTFKQPTQKDSLARSAYMARQEVWDPELARARDVHALLRECDIEKADGSPLWDPERLKEGKLSFKQWLLGWQLMGPEVAEAIWAAMADIAPTWNWRARTTEEGSFRQWDGAPPVQEEPAP